MCVIFSQLDAEHCSIVQLAWPGGLEKLKSNSLGEYPVGKAMLSFLPCYLREFLLYIQHEKKVFGK